MLGNLLCPADRRIQAFLDDYLRDVCPGGAAQLPGNTFLLDRPGLARVMSLPLGGDTLLRHSCSPTACRREFCTIRRATAAPRREFFTSWKVACRFRRISRRFRRQAFAALLAAALQPPAEPDDAAILRRSGRTDAAFCVAPAASDGVSGHRTRPAEDHGNSFSSRREAW